MVITYVGHACLHITTGDVAIAFDPWLDGPAYTSQWHIFPGPVDRAAVDDADVIVISHGHEDHLHAPTLARLDRDKLLVYPYYWYAETFQFLKELGFRQTIEAVSGERVALGPQTFMTAIVNGQDAILVVEAEGLVVVNVNDALHSSDARLIDLYTRMLKRRWPKIDVVFCGFGGASFFPNVFHCPGKNDVAVARLREQLYVHNFCRIVQRLAPDVAVPFAADFVLLDARQRWINETRFPREEIVEYYARNFAGSACPRITVMYPGDRLVDERLHPSLEHPAKARGPARDLLIRARYPEAVSAFTHAPRSELPGDRIASILREHLASEARFHGASALRGLRFALHLGDLASEPWFNVVFENRTAHVRRSDVPDSQAAVLIDTMASVVVESMTSDWGGDALVIGYGCEVDIRAADQAPRARTCVELLTRYPHVRPYAGRHPWRTLRYALHSLPAVGRRIALWLQRCTGRLAVASKPATRAPFWLTGDLDRIRRANGLPETR
jgi:L-ascorbate metabolism protein UlaG (beta-lactamase superfamily)